MSDEGPVVAISGASSFTGLWIARAFQADGWIVHALCPRQEWEYEGLRGIRVQLLRGSVQVQFGARAEDHGMASWIRDVHPAVWVHHHHWMESFRSPAYDVKRAQRAGLDPLPELVSALSRVRAAGVIYSGTFFEPGEGGVNCAASAMPYANTKRQVWLRLNELAQDAALPVSKVVIPNPIGPLENDDRIVPLLIGNSMRGQPFALNAPGDVSDYLPVSLLGKCYVSVARGLLEGVAQIRRPSCHVSSTHDWAAFVLSELVSRRLQINPCRLVVADRIEKPGKSFRNPEAERETVDWDEVWEEYAAWIRNLDLLRLWRLRD